MASQEPAGDNVVVGVLIQERMSLQRRSIFGPSEWNPQPVWLRHFRHPNDFWYAERNKVIQQHRNDGMTLKDIGDEFNISSERVRQILLKNRN